MISVLSSKRLALMLIVTVLINCVGPVSQACAWNDRIHMLIAYMAYQQLSPDKRESLAASLRQHPHCESFLQRDKPETCPEDLWLFMRAAVWPDYVNSQDQLRSEFHRAKWHYVNHPFEPLQSAETAVAPKHTHFAPNILTALDESFDLLTERYPSPARKAIATAWILHLVGDLHQPLHCVNLYSDRFPEGDQGGNKIAVRDGDRLIRLHAYWDNILGEQKDFESIVAFAQEFTEPLATHVQSFDKSSSLAWSAWSEESHLIAVKHVYLNGELPVTEWKKEMQDAGVFPEVPSLTEQYVKESREVARSQVRLATQRLVAVLTSMK